MFIRWAARPPTLVVTGLGAAGSTSGTVSLTRVRLGCDGISGDRPEDARTEAFAQDSLLRRLLHTRRSQNVETVGVYVHST
jgi:hypothetical protein